MVAHESQTPQLDELFKSCESNNKVLNDGESNYQMLSCAIPVWVTSRPFKNLHYTSYNIRRRVLGKRKTNNSTVTANSYLRNTRNLLNLISVKINKPAQSNLTGSKEVTKFALPNIYLINARSLLSKVDELTATLNVNSVNLVAVTENMVE